MRREGWKKVSIELSPMDIIDGDRGSNYPKQDEFYNSEHCLFLNTSNVTTQGFNFEKTMFITHEKDNLLRKGKLQKFDIILTTRGTVGNVAFYDDSVPYKNIRINSGMVIFRNSKPQEIETKYFYQFLRSSVFREQVLSHSSGSAQPQLPIQDLKQIELPLPPLSTQRRIADILCALDEKIELNRQTNATLEAIAQAIFKEWFVDFNFPGATGEMVESELGMIPHGWNVQKMGDDPVFVIDGDRGTNYPKQEDFINNGYCLFLSAKNVTEHGFDFSICQFISEDKDRILNKGKMIRNDIVLTTRGTVGNIAYYDDFTQFDNIRINSWMVIFRCHNSCYPFFLYLFLKSDYFKDQVTTLISGSAQPQLPIKDIRRIATVIPNTSVMNDFKVLLMPIENTIALNKQENATLIAIRDALLPKLMSGVIEV